MRNRNGGKVVSQLKIVGQWAEDIAIETHRIVRRSPYVKAICNGDMEAMKKGFWAFRPFVDQFNLSITNVTRALPPGMAPNLSKVGPEELAHSKLWELGARAMGVPYDEPYPDGAMKDGVQALTDFVSGVRYIGAGVPYIDPVAMFRGRFTTEEWAVGMSLEALGSPAFLSKIPDLRWFNAHKEEHMPPHSDLFVSAMAIHAGHDFDLDEQRRLALRVPHLFDELSRGLL